MNSYYWKDGNQNEYHSIISPPNDSAAHIRFDQRIRRKPVNGQGGQESYLLSSPDTEKLKPEPVGKPIAKRRFDRWHGWALISSIICFTLAVISVANERVSWRLGVIRQLIAVGFFLSIMNLNLGFVAPALFTLLEARFGKSSLQNYDSILRGQPLGPRLDLFWRIILSFMTGLPIGLSVAYKTFTGGFSQMSVSDSHQIKNMSLYGMLGPPGLQSNTGVALFSNATLPFVIESTSRDGTEPDVPSLPHTYGFNNILLSNQASAMLDVPHPDYVASIQASLRNGESWTVSAPVYGTIAEYNQTKASDVSTCEQFYEAAYESSGALTFNSLMNNKTVVLVNHPSPGPQDVQYIAVTTDRGINYYPEVDDFCRDAYAYDVTRQSCTGTWSITSSSISLESGSCNGTTLDETKQLIISDNSLFIGVWYMSALAEFLEPFSDSRMNSPWASPSMVTAISAAVWSRITVLNALNISNVRPTTDYGFTPQDLGILYDAADEAVHVRPTLRKSPWLYLILALPLFLTTCMLICITWLTSVPVSSGFGLVAILAGVDQKSLRILEGASLSGNLSKEVQLTIIPQDDRSFSSVPNQASRKVMYSLSIPEQTDEKLLNRNSRLRHGVVYQ